MEELLRQSGEMLWSWRLTLIHIVAIILVTVLVRRFLLLFINTLFQPAANAKIISGDAKRAHTLGALLGSILGYCLYFIAGIMILQEFYINTTSILAGAGVVGLALGVGAQGLVKDFITGFFIALENQFSIGDYVTIADITGTVQAMTFRVTKLKDSNGVVHVIPNSMVGKVANYVRGSMSANVYLPLPHSVPLPQALKLLQQASEQVAQECGDVIEKGPEVVGVHEITLQGYVVWMTADTKPMEHWMVERAIRRQAKIVLEDNGCDYPVLLQSPITKEAKHV